MTTQQAEISVYKHGPVVGNRYNDAEGEFLDTKEYEIVFDTPVGQIGIMSSKAIIGYHKVGAGKPAYSDPQYNEVNNPAEYFAATTYNGAVERPAKWWKPNTHMTENEVCVTEQEASIIAEITRFAGEKGLFSPAYENQNGRYRFVWHIA
jgi:hypothetical protein